MNSVGIALGSGGARGWCHIGVLRALEAMEMRPERIAGCSMGAIVGAAWAGGKLDPLEDWARGLGQTKFLSYVDLSLNDGGLVKGRAVKDMLRELGLPDKIEDLERPFVAVATDMRTGKEVRMDSGNLFDAVRASISIPGVFSPHPLEGKWLLDGGMINPVPTSALIALGPGPNIAVNPNGKFSDLWSPKPSSSFLDWIETPPFPIDLPDVLKRNLPMSKEQGPSYFDVVSTSIDIMTEFLREKRAEECPADVVLEADLNHKSVLELFRASEAIEEGARMVNAHADLLSEVVRPE